MERQNKTNHNLISVAGIAVMMVIPVLKVPIDRNPVIHNRNVPVETTIKTGSIVYDVNDENSKCDIDAYGNHLIYLIVGQNSNCPFEIDENTGEIKIIDTAYLSSAGKKVFQLIVYADNGTGSDDALITISIRKP
jgi:hypothetical protein